MAAPRQTFEQSVNNNYMNYIEPNYKFTESCASPAELREAFNHFANEILIRHDYGKAMAENREPKNAYAYAAHMGQFLRYLDAAKDEYIKALLAFHAEKDVPTPQNSKVTDRFASK